MTGSPSKTQLANFFLWFGCTGFGGIAMLPQMRRKMVETKKYVSAETFDRGLALAQFLPGVTMVQVASYIGFQAQGYCGALLSAAGIFMPAALLMYILTLLYNHFQSAAIVAPVIEGMNAVIVVIVIDAAFKAARSNLGNSRRYFTAACGFFLYLFHVNAVAVIALSVLIGMLLCNDKKPAAVRHQAAPARYKTLIAIYLLLTLSIIAIWAIDRKTGLLALLMFKTGLLAYGGGYAAIPIYMHDIVNSEHWLTMQQFMVGITLGQITPGPVIVTAIYIGYSLLGTLGSLVAFVFILFPDMLLALLILPWFDRLLASKWFSRGMQGVLCAFVGMLLSTAATMAQQLTAAPLTIALLVAAVILIMIKKVPPYLVILLAAISEIAAHWALVVSR